MIVELGGGTAPRPDADVVIDLHHPKGAPAQDAAHAPWLAQSADGVHLIPASSVTEVSSSHFLEHVPHGQPLLNVMNEAWRVLVPGGRFVARLPLVGYTDPATGAPMSNHIGWQPWADPTHVSYWWLPEAVLYFCEGAFKPNADYGVSTWRPMGPFSDAPHLDPLGGWTVREGWEGLFVIFKP